MFDHLDNESSKTTPVRSMIARLIAMTVAGCTLTDTASAQSSLPSTLASPIRPAIQQIALDTGQTSRPAMADQPHAWQAARLADSTSEAAGLTLSTRNATSIIPDGRMIPESHSPDGFHCLSSECWRADISGPWPADEYLCDGGDANVRVVVGQERRVSGLDLEDTVVHFDTPDGRTIVTPTNNVCIYAPRFASVRKVFVTKADERLLRPVEAEQPWPILVGESARPPIILHQPEQADRLLDIDGAVALRDRTRGVELENHQRVAELSGGFEVYEDFQVMRIGVAKRSQKARLIESMTAAIIWSEAESPEVLLNLDRATVDTTDQKTGVVYQSKTGPPRLRVIKLASTPAARPGEEVEFTLRFDNVGEQSIDNVTVIDNLTTRLEYVPDSSQSNREVVFSSELNEGESLVLRWDLQEPLRPGDGGMIRFRCKVR